MNRVFVVFLTVFLIMMSNAQANPIREFECKVSIMSTEYGWNNQKIGKSLAYTKSEFRKVMSNSFADEPELINFAVKKTAEGYNRGKKGLSRNKVVSLAIDECVL